MTRIWSGISDMLSNKKWIGSWFQSRMRNIRFKFTGISLSRRNFNYLTFTSHGFRKMFIFVIEMSLSTYKTTYMRGTMHFPKHIFSPHDFRLWTKMVKTQSVISLTFRFFLTASFIGWSIYVGINFLFSDSLYAFHCLVHVNQHILDCIKR